MMTGTLTHVAEVASGRLSGADGRFFGLSTDTRTLKEGELFVALDGPNFSGRDFVAAAAEKQAAGAVVAGRTSDDVAQIDVADTRVALGLLASDWCRQMPARIVALTGSNGKTTLKELTARCLAQGANTLATEGNLNNDIGVPLMLSRIAPEHEFAVIEMGANRAGEIAYLTELAAPEVVAITNAAAAHLEGFGSLDGVATAKGEILCGQRRPAAAILNADDRYYDLWRSLASDVPIVSFAIDNEADVRASALQETASGTSFELRLPEERVVVRLPLSGRHNVMNAAAAAAIAIAVGVDAQSVVRGLESAVPVAGRLRPISIAPGVTFFDDSYNANPASVLAAVRFLASQAGLRWLVLGDMGELGADAASLHEQVGKDARDAGIDRLFTVGELSRYAAKGFVDDAQWYRSMEDLVDALRGALRKAPGAVTVLVKGSRSARMERVIEAMTGASLGRS